MRLSSIKLSGFKSFVDSTIINLDSNLVGVVGPNGCGKSNVIDAVKWVLGESSAKNLRSDSMSDVIFNGSETRKPVGTASVELIFDNEDRTISGPYAQFNEVSVRRVVSRDGLSNYYLNNTNCRRKDITNLLLGTGLGSSGYSIIEQGMISKIIDAKPDEIRSYLEEAAGVTKFKERRKDTLNRLRHTQENLDRIEDIIQEVSKQLDKLTRQAKNAERYKELKQEQLKVNSEIIFLRIREIDSKKELLDQSLLNLRNDRERISTEKIKLVTELSTLKTKADESQEVFDTLQKNFYQTGSKISNLESQKSLINDTIQSINQDIEKIHHDLENSRQMLTEDANKLDDSSTRDNTLNPELNEKNLLLNKQTSALELLSEEMKNIQASKNEASTTNNRHNSELIKLDADIDQNSENISRINRTLDDINSQLSDISKKTILDVESNENDINALKDKQSALISNINEHQNLCDGIKENLESLHLNHNNLKTQLSKNIGQVESLKEFLNLNKPEIDSSLKENLELRKSCSDLLKVEEGWESAIDIVLGDRLNSYFLNNEINQETIRELSDYESISLENLTNNQSMTIPAGSLHSKIITDYLIEELIHIRAVENIDEAIEHIEDLKPNQSVITKSGIWLSKNFYRSASSGQEGILSIEKKIHVLNDEIDGIRALLDKDSTKINGVKINLDEEIKIIESLKEAIDLNKEALDDQIIEQNRLIAHNDAIKDRKITLENQKALLEKEKLDREQISKDKHSTKKILQNKIDEYAARLDQLSTQELELMSKIEELNLDITINQKRLHEIEIEIKEHTTIKSSTETGIQRLENQIQILEENLISRNNSLNNKNLELNEVNIKLDTTLVEYQKLDEKVIQSKSELSEISSNILAIEDSIAVNDNKINQLRDQIETNSLANKELEVNHKNLNDDLAELGISFNAVSTTISDAVNLTEHQDLLDSISRKLSNLGAINLAAIEEKEELDERKSFLDEQFDDLTSAIRVLQEAINKIDNETKEKFREMFEGANQALKYYFPKLFGGGHAFLELESEDLLTAGVYIMSSPPGKKINNISMLSGGEKTLTAIAFIFSMFHLNPSPFCLLDEVDAPLDESNVGRFSELVAAMSEKVQFLLITHNQATMEVLESLMGVTMAEPGVSRIVSVNMKDAVSLVDE